MLRYGIHTTVIGELPEQLCGLGVEIYYLSMVEGASGSGSLSILLVDPAIRHYIRTSIFFWTCFRLNRYHLAPKKNITNRPPTAVDGAWLKSRAGRR